MPRIKVETVVICDDVRRESSGKHILIGVYGGHIGLPAFPFNMRPCWWIQTFPEQAGLYNIDFRIMGPNDAQLLQGKAVINIKEVKRTVINFNHTPIQIQGEGPIRLQWRLEPDQNWETIKEMDVVLRHPKLSPSSAEISMVGAR